MELYFKIAGDKDNTKSDFYIDRTWSGRSTASSKANLQECDIVSVDTITIDSLFIDQTVDTEVIFFKLDVEGYEPLVFKGMKSLLMNSEKKIGLIEFNPAFMCRVDVSLDDYLEYLTDMFYIFNPIDFDLVKEYTTDDLNKLIRNNDNIELDLLLLSHKSLLKDIGLRVIK